MSLSGRLIAHLDQAQLIEITLEEFQFDVYVALRDADVEHVANLVPADKFAGAGDVHVAAISGDQDAQAEINDMLFNLNPSDTMVFLCTDKQAYINVLSEFEQEPLTIHRS